MQVSVLFLLVTQFHIVLSSQIWATKLFLVFFHGFCEVLLSHLCLKIIL
jgi:hypothetical protein